MFKMQPGKVNSEMTLSLWLPPDQKYLTSMGSCNTMFSLPSMTGKWQKSKTKHRTELIPVVVEAGSLGYSAAETLP